MLSENRIAEIVDEHCDLKSQIVRMVNVRLAIKQAIKEERELICDYLDDEHRVSHREADIAHAHAIHVVREGGPDVSNESKAL